MRWMWAAALFVASLGSARADECPAILREATQLVLAIAPSMETSAARVASYERRFPSGDWRRRSSRREAVLGAAGLGWGFPFRSLRQGDEPLKAEGDKRTPAGFYRFGAPFGFEGKNLPNFTTLEKDRHYCVDDARSPHYGRILPKPDAGAGVSGENMAEIDLYRNGVFIDYPTSAAERAGSCIFLHVWRGPGRPTAGCVALAEDDVTSLQGWLKPGAVIGILPRFAISRFQDCLPGL